jgi:hypothetical protein
VSAPDGLDQSWSVADPQTCANHGIKVVSMYLSPDPSKNATAAKIRAYHQAKSPLVPYGVGVWLNWEAYAGAALGGASVGAQHGYAAAQQVKILIQQTGYAPKGRVVIPASYDFDSNPGQYPVIDAYASNFKAQVNPQGFGAGCYGEADLIEHLHAAGLTEAEWQTYAWSGGRLSSEADFYQYMNGQTFAGASVDFNRVIHGPQMGAWWPPGHPLDSADSGLGSGIPLEDDMTPEQDAKLDKIIAQTATANSGLTVANQQGEFNAVLNALKLAGGISTLLSDPTNGVVVQLAQARAQIAALTAEVAALKVGSAVTPEQLAAISQAAKDGAAIVGHNITLNGSIA